MVPGHNYLYGCVNAVFLKLLHYNGLIIMHGVICVI